MVKISGRDVAATLTLPGLPCVTSTVVEAPSMRAVVSLSSSLYATEMPAATDPEPVTCPAIEWISERSSALTSTSRVVVSFAPFATEASRVLRMKLSDNAPAPAKVPAPEPDAERVLMVASDPARTSTRAAAMVALSMVAAVVLRTSEIGSSGSPPM